MDQLHLRTSAPSWFCMQTTVLLFFSKKNSGGRNNANMLFNTYFNIEQDDVERRRRSFLGDSEALSRVERIGAKSTAGWRAPGYWLSPDHFQNLKRMLAPDWAQKNALFRPIGEQHMLSSFGVFVHDGY